MCEANPYEEIGVGMVRFHRDPLMRRYPVSSSGTGCNPVDPRSRGVRLPHGAL